MPLSQLPAFLSACFADLCAALDPRSAPRLFQLLGGALFARGRRTVTSWFRAADITTDFRPAYHALWAAGRRAECLALHLLLAVLKPLMSRLAGDHLLFAIDDTPTARYGPKVQGAGIHHNPTPGPAGARFFYGHSGSRSAASSATTAEGPSACSCSGGSISGARTSQSCPRRSTGSSGPSRRSPPG